MYRPSILITPKSFNADKLVISVSKDIRIKGDLSLKFTEISLSEISYLNDSNEACQLFISLPTVETYGPYPQYNIYSTKKSSKDISGYTISYTNDEVIKLFKTIQKTVSKKWSKLNLKPVFSEK